MFLLRDLSVEVGLCCVFVTVQGKMQPKPLLSSYLGPESASQLIHTVEHCTTTKGDTQYKKMMQWAKCLPHKYEGLCSGLGNLHKARRDNVHL